MWTHLKSVDAPPERILVFRIGQLGDTIISLPALWTIRRQFPQARITLLTDQHPGKSHVTAMDLLAGTRLVDEFQPYTFSGIQNHSWSRPWHMTQTALQLRKKGFKALAYLAPSSRTSAQISRDIWFFTAVGVEHGWGFFPFPEDRPASARATPAAPVHEADRLLTRLERSGFQVPPCGEGCMDLDLGEREEWAVKQWLAALPGDGDRIWLAVGPGSKMPAKRWDPRRYNEVVRTLIAERDVWPVVFGGPEDATLAAELLKSWGRGYNAAGRLNVRASAAALRRCALYLGNDTGTMHLAAAVGTCCAAIFSARTIRGRWYPYGAGHSILRATIDCEHCELIECHDRANECLRRIDKTEVTMRCLEILDISSKTGA